MYQRKDKVLAISLACPTTVEVGDPVVIDSDLTVAAISADAEDHLVGTVAYHAEDADVCVVETRFRERRDDRTAGEVFDCGPFVWDASGEAVEYVPAFQASVTSSEEETYAITLDTNDHIKVGIDGGSGQDITLTAGGTQSAANIATDINGTAVGFTADGSSGYVVLTADNIGEDLEIMAVTHDCYTEVGFTVGTTEGDASHDAGAIAGMQIRGPQPLAVDSTIKGPYDVVNGTNDALKIKIGSGGSQTFDLTSGTETITAQDVADIINATATDFEASEYNNRVRLTCDNAGDALEFETVANDAYDTLGFEVGSNAAPMDIETLEY